MRFEDDGVSVDPVVPPHSDPFEAIKTLSDSDCRELLNDLSCCHENRQRICLFVEDKTWYQRRAYALDPTWDLAMNIATLKPRIHEAFHKYCEEWEETKEFMVDMEYRARPEEPGRLERCREEYEAPREDTLALIPFLPGIVDLARYSAAQRGPADVLDLLLWMLQCVFEIDELGPFDDEPARQPGRPEWTLAFQTEWQKATIEVIQLGLYLASWPYGSDWAVRTWETVRWAEEEGAEEPVKVELALLKSFFRPG